MGEVIGDLLPVPLGLPTTQTRPESVVQGPLDELRQWLTLHNAAVMSALLLVIGVAIIGQGLAGF